MASCDSAEAGAAMLWSWQYTQQHAYLDEGVHHKPDIAVADASTNVELFSNMLDQWKQAHIQLCSHLNDSHLLVMILCDTTGVYEGCLGCQSHLRRLQQRL
jgi:hypothetical protein